MGDQLQSAGFGDLFVHNQAVATGQLAGNQQLGSGRVAADGQAFNLEPKLERVSNRKITADDDDDEPIARQFVLMCHALAVPAVSGSPASYGKKHQMEAPFLIWLKFAKRQLEGLQPPYNENLCPALANLFV